MDVVRIAIPLLIYFVVMFLMSFYEQEDRTTYATDISIPPSKYAWRSQGMSCSNCIGTLLQSWGLWWKAVMIGLVNVAFWLKKRYFAND
jgi:ACR3 family arsenite transporter